MNNGYEKREMKITSPQRKWVEDRTINANMVLPPNNEAKKECHHRIKGLNY